MGLILLGICVLIFTIIRGCNKSANKEIAYENLKEDFNNLALKRERDSLSALQAKKDYEDSLSFVRGQLALNENQKQSIEDRLLLTANDAAKWRDKYEKVKPDTNASITLVPNDFIEDCHNCFDSLDYKNQLIKLYVTKSKEVEASHKELEKVQEKRIATLTSEKNAFHQNANDAIALAAKYQNACKPKGRAFFTLSAIGGENVWIMGVGGGGFYMDKRERCYGGNVYGTNQGTMVTANLSLPLSFRRK